MQANFGKILSILKDIKESGNIYYRKVNLRKQGQIGHKTEQTLTKFCCNNEWPTMRGQIKFTKVKRQSRKENLKYMAYGSFYEPSYIRSLNQLPNANFYEKCFISICITTIIVFLLKFNQIVRTVFCCTIFDVIASLCLACLWLLATLSRLYYCLWRSDTAGPFITKSSS